LNWTVTRLAEEIVHLAERWAMPARGVADDEIFAHRGMVTGTIAHEFANGRVHFAKARKGRRTHGWEVMRRLMADAESPERSPEKPGLYVSRRCLYWWSTVPFLARDKRNPQDIDSRQPDHGADATRYACIWSNTKTRFTITELRL
jgi:hypothetical protein